MNLFITSDGDHYRRWMNLLLAYLFPGVVHLLAGRIRAGLLWMAGMVGLFLISLLLVMNPDSGYTYLEPHWFDFISFAFQLGVVLFSYRVNIPRSGKKKWTRVLGGYVASLAVPLLMIRQFWMQPFVIPTGSMSPTLQGISEVEHSLNDHILVDKTAYKASPPSRGDIVVFRTAGIDSPYIQKNTLWIKRVVGLPGETVSISPPYVLINGERVISPKVFQEMAEKTDSFPGYVLARGMFDGVLESEQDSITLGSDEYFLLGDNSPRSLDSRFYGPIKRQDLVGKAIYLFAPSHRKRWLQSDEDLNEFERETQ